MSRWSALLLSVCGAAFAHERGIAQAQDARDIRIGDQPRRLPPVNFREAAQTRAAHAKTDAPGKKALDAAAPASTERCLVAGQYDPSCGGATLQPVLRCGDPSLRLCREGLCESGGVCGANALTGGAGASRLTAGHGHGRERR